MLKDLTGQKNIDKEVIVAAIKSLKEKGWDVNPYSVADEAKISRSAIVRDAELMELVAQARSAASAEGETAADLSRRLAALEEQSKELHYQKIQLHEHVAELQEQNRQQEEQIEELEAQNKQLRHHNKQLQQQVGPLSEKTAKLKEQLEKLKDRLGQPPENLRENFTERVSHLEADNARLQEQSVQLTERNKQLYDQIVQLLDQEEELQEQAGQLRAQLAQALSESSGESPAAELLEEMESLQAQIVKLRSENENLAATVNLVWQQGYLMGQHDGQQAATEEMKRLAGTANSVTTPAGAEIETPGQELEPESEPVASADMDIDLSAQSWSAGNDTADEGTFSEDDSPMGDPFTTRLWEALQSDSLEEPLTAGFTDELSSDLPGMEPSDALSTQAFPRSYDEPSFDRVRLEAIPPDEQLVAPPPGSQAHSYFSCNPDGILDAAGAQDGDAKSSAFTESELRDLLKNRFARGEEPAEKEPEPVKDVPPAPSKKFVGTNRQGQDPPPTASRVFPPEIRKACLLLGVKADELTRQQISEAWKREMAKPGVHPDTGGDTEMAIYLNTAKDTLMRWVDDQSPKLGKKFGATRDHHKHHPDKQE